ncbi:putative interleukin-17 receptor E-like isoform X2 [Rhinatrema bivittatum]|uniref:putative interleukin-17 receptor E-like isoform X2 n=1 Tax=Rhinatrema bivittatum TaxID=194408 RepID=UPI0011289EC7|nr:putative interleukin-17 receptor E-like isoform X2 [Rhinatrema bivittatum]
MMIPKPKQSLQGMMSVNNFRFLLLLIWGISACQAVSRIEECGLTCSQAFHCKRKANYDIFNQFCQDPPASLSHSVLENMKISTVMKCVRKKQCSLHLNVKGTVNFDENIHGVEICSLSLDTSWTQCQSVRLTRSKRKNSKEQKVQVQFNCFEVSPGQHVHVTLKTIPNYCDVNLEQHYYVEDCRNGELGKNIPVCIAGKLDYKVDKVKKAISIHVSDFLEDQDYHVRLCHKWFSCEDTGAHALIKGEDPSKSVSLPYSQLLPCLCIEGWSAIPDSRRIQLCPFKNDTETLWDGATYDTITQTLAWQPSCPVQASISLCWLTEFSDQCANLPDSSRTVPGKVEYDHLDTHPRLCMKFTTQHGSWVRCPFANGRFPGWNMKMEVTKQQVQVIFTSQTQATFSVAVCNRTQFPLCENLQKLPSLHVGNLDSVSLNISSEICGSDICIQGWRTDVNHSFPIQICDIPCPLSLLDRTSDNETCLQLITLAVTFMILVTMLALIGHITLRVYYRRKLDHKSSFKMKVQHISSGLDFPEKKEDVISMHTLG